MFTKRNGIVHEQVASVMAGMGLVIENNNADPSNNSRFVAEGVHGLAGLVTEQKGGKAKPIVESDCGDDKGGKTKKYKKDKDGKDVLDKDGNPIEESHTPESMDETDGDPDLTTTAKNSTSSTVNADHTSTEVDPKGSKKGKGPVKTKGKVEEGTIEEAAQAFYENLDKPVTFVIYENEEVEVFGLTNEDVAPFGGSAPIMPAVMKSQAKDGGSNKKGDTGVLMLYSTKGMDERTKKMLTGQHFRACGWSTPPKGTGMKASKKSE